MKSLTLLLINTFFLGCWAMAIYGTIIGKFEFNWLLFGIIPNIIGFLIFYFDVKESKEVKA